MPGPGSALGGLFTGWANYGQPSGSTGQQDSLDEMLKKLAELAKKKQAAPAPGQPGVGGAGGTQIYDPSGVMGGDPFAVFAGLK